MATCHVVRTKPERTWDFGRAVCYWIAVKFSRFPGVIPMACASAHTMGKDVHAGMCGQGNDKVKFCSAVRMVVVTAQ